MKKIVKKATALLAGTLMIGSLTGCASFDASAYVNAVLANSYYNDSTAIVEQQIATAEEATAVYEAGMEAQMNAMLADVVLSEALYQEYEQFYKDLYANVKFTVGEAVKIDKENYEVSVSYEKMHVFEDGVDRYEDAVAEFVQVWTDAALAGEEVPSDEEMNEQLFHTFKDCMVAELAEAEYDAPAEMMIRVELIDNVWTANQEDILSLESALVDFEKLYE